MKFFDKKSAFKRTMYKFSLIMRLIFLFSVIFTCSIWATAYSQNTKLSLDVRSTSIKNVLHQIESQTEFRFIYETGKINMDKKISIRVANETVEDILDQIFRGENINYMITEDHLILIDPWAAAKAKESAAALLQAIKISGTIVDITGEPLPGVNIVVKGTFTGTVTDMNGQYSINVPNSNTVLQFSSMGYLSQEITVGDQTNINVTLQDDVKQLEEVVVTALGIKRAKKALGYSTQDIGSDELLESRTSSLANALVGKVAGAQISESGTGMGGSTRIVVRGVSSLAGKNQPLWVVDGIPIDDSQISSVANDWGGTDNAGMAAQLNPDDIESISILKGPNASALYGTRAANGVVLVTTKKGAAGKWTVNFNSNLTGEFISSLPNFQNTYGQGSSGVYNVEAPGAWGPVMDGRNVTNFRGQTVAFVPQPNREKDFFDTGYGFTNTLAISGGNDMASVRLSLNDSRNKGITPTHRLDRQGIDLHGNLKLGKRLLLSAKANYIRENVKNPPSTGQYSTMNNFLLMPRSVRLEDLSPSRVDGQHVNYIPNNSFNINPMFGPEWNRSYTKTDRLLGYVSADLMITENLSISGKTGLDYYAINGESKGYPWEPTSYRSYSVNNGYVVENNSDVLVKYNQRFGKIDVGLNAGAAIMHRQDDKVSVTSPNQNGPDFFSMSNGSSLNPSETKSEKEIQSVYGMANFAYDDYVYLDFTARNDWSSTLPADNRSFFYPSVSLGYIFSEMMNKINNPLPSWVTFIKLRGSWAQVGNDTDPYRLASTYEVSPRGTGGVPFARFYTEQPLSNLKPEITTSVEFGGDIRFFDNRLGLDVTYYNAKTKNQILSLNVGVISGAQKQIINAGEVQNKGLEIMLNAVPVKTKEFVWDLTINYAHNKNKVVELAEGIPYWSVGGSQVCDVRAYPGEAFGDIYARTFKRNDNGQILVGPDGTPIIENTYKKVGNINPDWYGSIINSFSYKGITLRALIDGRFGGQVMSMTESATNANGNGARTEDRSDILVEGVTEAGAVNTNRISAQSYWSTVSGGWGRNGIADEYLYKATFVKFRELSLTWSLPKKWINPLFMSNASISLQGRNLFYIYRKTPGTNPEGSFGRLDSVQGYEYATMPETRTFGINLNLTF